MVRALKNVSTGEDPVTKTPLFPRDQTVEVIRLTADGAKILRFRVKDVGLPSRARARRLEQPLPIVRVQIDDDLDDLGTIPEDEEDDREIVFEGVVDLQNRAKVEEVIHEADVDNSVVLYHPQGFDWLPKLDDPNLAELEGDNYVETQRFKASSWLIYEGVLARDFKARFPNLPYGAMEKSILQEWYNDIHDITNIFSFFKSLDPSINVPGCIFYTGNGSPRVIKYNSIPLPALGIGYVSLKAYKLTSLVETWEDLASDPTPFRSNDILEPTFFSTFLKNWYVPIAAAIISMERDFLDENDELDHSEFSFSIGMRFQPYTYSIRQRNEITEQSGKDPGPSRSYGLSIKSPLRPLVSISEADVARAEKDKDLGDAFRVTTERNAALGAIFGNTYFQKFFDYDVQDWNAFEVIETLDSTEERDKYAESVWDIFELVDAMRTQLGSYFPSTLHQIQTTGTMEDSDVTNPFDVFGNLLFKIEKITVSLVHKPSYSPSRSRERGANFIGSWFHKNNIFRSYNDRRKAVDMTLRNLGCFSSFSLPTRLTRGNMLWIPRNEDQDCTLWCISRFLRGSECFDDESAISLRLFSANMRNLLGHNHALGKEDMETVAKYIQRRIIVYQLNTKDKNASLLMRQRFQWFGGKILGNIIGIIQKVAVFNPACYHRDVIHLLGANNHCCLMLKNKSNHFDILDFIRCGSCKKWIKCSIYSQYCKHFANCYRCECGTATLRNGNHSVNCRGLRARNLLTVSTEGIKTTLVDSKEMKVVFRDTKSPGWDKNQYFADLETFTLPNGNYVVYAAAIVGLNGDVKIFYGKEALREFVIYILELDNANVWFFNGSSFDSYFVLKELIRQQARFGKRSLCKQQNNNKIYELKIGSGKNILRVKDLYLFLTGSLARCCKDFGLPEEFSKGDFDHSLMQCWSDTVTHRAELVAYLELDVIALREIYRKFASGIFEKYQLNIGKFCSKAGLAMGAFSLTIPRQLLFSNKIVFDEIVRKAYFGGRTDPQTPHYISKYYEAIVKTINEKGSLTKEEFDNVDEYTQYLDVNSLYPSVMFNEKMPVGVPNHYKSFDNDELPSLNNCMHRDIWMRRLLLVDVTCPKDIVTPYLFDRNDKGGLIKNLEDKVKKWYCGVDLFEACKLGYRVTKVHEYIEWPRLEYIFKEFIGKEWEAKAKAQRGSILYLLAKLLMNSLSGKFAQRNDGTELTLLLGDALKKKLPNPETVKSFDFLFNSDAEEDEILAIFLERYTNEEWSRFPVYISCFILGHSRALMSKYLRFVDGYRNIENSFLYTDTDSLVLRSHVYPLLEKQNCVGKALGALSDELDGGKIVKATFLAPKTYQLVWISAEDYTLKVTTKCKGIPHSSADLDARESYVISDPSVRKHVEHIKKWLEDSSSTGRPPVEFKKPYYLISDTSSKDYSIVSSLGLDVFEEVLHENISVCCLFGSMIKHFGVSNFDGKDFLNIEPAYRQRGLYVTDWWRKTTKRDTVTIDGQRYSVPSMYDGDWKDEEKILCDKLTEMILDEECILRNIK